MSKSYSIQELALAMGEAAAANDEKKLAVLREIAQDMADAAPLEGGDGGDGDEAAGYGSPEQAAAAAQRLAASRAPAWQQQLLELASKLARENPPEAADVEEMPATLIELPDIRQDTHWSCGAMAAMSVGRYFGVGPKTKEEWIAALGTTEEKSTSAQAIIAYLQSLGLQVEAQDNMDMEDLAACWRAGKPVIVCCQDYMGVNAALEKAEWDYGHWLCYVGGPALGYCYFQDSSADNALGRPGGTVDADADDAGSDAAPGKVMIRVDDWLKLWHDVGEDGTKFIHYGIAVGPAPTPT